MTESPSKKIKAACLILAGGQGKRLTPDKPLLEVDGQPIIGRAANVVRSVFEEVLLVTNTPGKYEFLGAIYELDDFRSPTDESVARLRALIDEAFGRSKAE